MAHHLTFRFGWTARGLAIGVFFLLGAAAARIQAEDAASAAENLRQLSPDVFEGDDQDNARRMVREKLRARLQQANDASRREWLSIESRAQWEAFRDERVTALRQSLGQWPPAPKEVRKIVAGTVAGDGFVIENIVYQSRPGWWVTANLYRPAKPTAAMPGLIISHSHHRPKEHGELQDMGMTWARAGCVVLVPDHLGHGERGQHGFTSSDDFARDFRVSRQDYYFRYDNSMQLYLVGDSLMQWMAWDLMRGVDVLLAEDGVDEDKIILLGAVAGGGDPCAVTAALDERIDCAVPFNFGGPQPETRYPLPEDAETWFNYAGSGSWESTRNLPFSATDESRFLPWEIVASIAPRRLIFAHEFNWHRERDPVWKRLQAVYELYDARDHLAYTHGRGELRGSSPEATHCTHIGRFHRVKIHEAFADWFDIDATEYSKRVDSSRLKAAGALERADVQNAPLCRLLDARARAALANVRNESSRRSPDEQRVRLRQQLAALLGDVDTGESTELEVKRAPGEHIDQGAHTCRVERMAVNGAPMLLLTPGGKANQPRPVVVGLAQSGKAAFLKYRADEIAKLLSAGVAVCLPDVHNTGELAGDSGRGRYSSATSRAATALMVGDPIVAQQLRDVRSIVEYLRSRKDIDKGKIALWGESFAELNEVGTNFRVPRRIDGRPQQAEPLGGMLALLAALYDNGIAAVYIHRGLAEFRGALEGPFVYLPLDSIIPGLLNRADVPDIAAALAPTPVQLVGMVDAYNRPLSAERTTKLFAPATGAYNRADAEDKLRIAQLQIAQGEASPADWLRKRLGQ